MVAAVEHPNIVPVYDTGDVDGILFIAMRYIRGGDVRSLLADGQAIPAARSRSIISQIAAALDTAHTHDLVHRDVKPANMLLDAARRPTGGQFDRSGALIDHVYLSDFGISKYLATSKLTSTGHFVGTLDYIAPEQIEGKVIDGRADQYSLACAAHEMFTGVPPFRSDEIVAMISAHLTRPPPSAAALCPGLPEAVDQVLARAMAKSPADRYPTCTDFADGLSRALAAPPGQRTITAARPKHVPSTAPVAAPAGESAGERDKPPRRRRRPSGGPILAAITAAGLAVGVILIATHKAPHPRHNPAAFSSPTSKFITSRSPSPALQGKNPFASLPRYPASVTAAVYDAVTGKTYLLHPGVREHTASTVKVEIMGTLLHQAQVAGSPLPGTELSLITSMIEVDDNSAATQLLEDVGGPSAVRRFDDSVGMTATEPHATTPYIDNDPGLPAWELTTTTAADEVKLVRAFVYPNRVLNTTSRNYGVNLMEHVEAYQAWGVTAGVGPGTTVALKDGWLPLDVANNSDWQVDSIGWVKGNGRDYVLAVLTNDNSSEQAGIDTIGHISAAVYAQLRHN